MRYTFRDMLSEGATSQPSAENRREYFRVNAICSVNIQAGTDAAGGEFIEQLVNISGGGIGLTVNVVYHPDQVLLLTLMLPGQVIFKAHAKALRLDPIPHHVNTYNLYTRFIRRTAQNQELLIRSLLPFQRDRYPASTRDHQHFLTRVLSFPIPYVNFGAGVTRRQADSWR